MKKSVDNYITDRPQWSNELQLLREILLSFDVEEEVKWGAPVYTVNGKNVIGIGAFKSYVGLWFFQGALLNDKYKVLINAQEGKTRAQRQWRFNNIEEIDINRVEEYIKEAIANQKQVKEIKPQQKKQLEIPQVLINLLHEEKSLLKSFTALPKYKQNEFAEYISEAKRETTKLNRIEKIKPMILKGIGLNDRYR